MYLGWSCTASAYCNGCKRVRVMLRVSVELASFEVLVDTVSSKRFHNQIEGHMIHVLVPLGTACLRSVSTTLCD